MIMAENTRQNEFSEELPGWREESSKSEVEVMQGISVNAACSQQILTFLIGPDGKLRPMKNPDNDHNQTWSKSPEIENAKAGTGLSKSVNESCIAAAAVTTEEMEIAVTDSSTYSRSPELEPVTTTVLSTNELSSGETRILQLDDYNEVFQLKVTLLGSHPPIWRRIQVPASYTFFDLHIAIQDTMEGWLDIHPHEFKLPNGSVVDYSEKQWKTQNGWHVQIWDHFGLSKPGETGPGYRNPKMPDLSATVNETSMDEDMVDAAFMERVKKFVTDSEYLLPSQRMNSPEQAANNGLPIDVNAIPGSMSNTASGTTPPFAHANQWRVMPEYVALESNSSSCIVQRRRSSDEEPETIADTLSNSSSSGYSNQETVKKSAQKKRSDDAKPDKIASKKKKISEKEKPSPRPKKCVYTYDFVDNWQMSVVLEQILPRDLTRSYPASVGGKRRCPPEHCGGITGYYGLLQDISQEQPNSEKWIQAMMQLCDTDRDHLTGVVYNPNSFKFRDVVFQDPRKRLVETLESIPIPPNIRHETFLRLNGYRTD